MSLELIGYRFSVYAWAARMGLAEAGLTADYVEVDPFDLAQAAALRRHHPFGRVPVLRDGAFRLFETAAILRYLLPEPQDRKTAARARQVAGIADAYGYWPLVRQVFSQAVFGPAQGQRTDRAELAEGLAAAGPVLAALDEIAAEGLVLDGKTIGATDCHLAPMIGYFAQAPEGRGALAQTPALERWFGAVSARRSYLSTRPDLSRIGETR